MKDCYSEDYNYILRKKMGIQNIWKDMCEDICKNNLENFNNNLKYLKSVNFKYCDISSPKSYYYVTANFSNIIDKSYLDEYNKIKSRLELNSFLGINTISDRDYNNLEFLKDKLYTITFMISADFIPNELCFDSYHNFGIIKLPDNVTVIPGFVSTFYTDCSYNELIRIAEDTINEYKNK